MTSTPERAEELGDRFYELPGNDSLPYNEKPLIQEKIQRWLGGLDFGGASTKPLAMATADYLAQNKKWLAKEAERAAQEHKDISSAELELLRTKEREANFVRDMFGNYHDRKTGRFTSKKKVFGMW